MKYLLCLFTSACLLLSGCEPIPNSFTARVLHTTCDTEGCLLTVATPEGSETLLYKKSFAPVNAGTQYVFVVKSTSDDDYFRYKTKLEVVDIKPLPYKESVFVELPKAKP